MFLLEHKVINCGPFKGENKIRFSTDPGRPVTLVGGKNGCGKTTILESILFVLYGPRSRNLLGFKHYSEYLLGLIHDGCDEASVSLTFLRKEQGEERCYQVSRLWYLTDDNNAKEKLEIFVDEVNRPDLADSWPEYVEQILPESLAGLFIFDGERIKELAEEETSTRALRSALFGLLGLDLVEKLQIDIGEFRQRVLKDSTEDGTLSQEQLDMAEFQLEQAELAVRTTSEALTKTNVDLENARQELVSRKELFSKSGGDLFKERENLAAELTATQQRLEVNKSEALKLAASELPLFLVEELLTKIVGVGESIKKLEEAEFLRDSYKKRDELILSRLEGETFDKNQIAFLERVMAEDRGVYDFSYTPSFNVQPETFREVLTLFSDSKLRNQRALAEVSTTFTKEEKRSEELQSALSKVPTGEEISKIILNVHDAEQRFNAEMGNVKKAEESLRSAENTLEQSKRNFEKIQVSILEDSAAGSRSNRINREVQGAKEILSNFKTRIISSSLERIQNEVTDALSSLYRKKNLVKRVIINSETLAIDLLQEDGEKIAPERLSSGERQLLATALLWGMARASDTRLPMILDTPLARLDSSHRERLVTNYFPIASHQVILLSTDEEVIGDYYTALKPRIGSEYHLEHDEVRSKTRVKEGYFPSFTSDKTGELVPFPTDLGNDKRAQSE